MSFAQTVLVLASCRLPGWMPGERAVPRVTGSTLAARGPGRVHARRDGFEEFKERLGRLPSARHSRTASIQRQQGPAGGLAQ